MSIYIWETSIGLPKTEFVFIVKRGSLAGLVVKTSKTLNACSGRTPETSSSYPSPTSETIFKPMICVVCC